MNERVMTSRAGLPLSERRWVRLALPITVFVLALVLWELVVRLNHIPHYILPGLSRRC